MNIRIRFSLRTAILAVTIASAFFGWYAFRMRDELRHRNAVRAIVEMGGDVKYESGEWGLGELSVVEKWFPKQRVDKVVSVQFQLTSGNWSRESMIQLKPHLESFSSLRSLHINNSEMPPNALKGIEDLTGLESLLITNARITNDDLGHIRGLANLRYLLLRQTAIDDDGLEHLLGMKKLETIDLCFNEIGDKGISKLKALKSVRHLGITETNVTESKRNELQLHWKDCRIRY